MTKKLLPKDGFPIGFDPKFYLEINVDVAEAGLDPFDHYENFGRDEGRIYQRPIPHWSQFDESAGCRGYVYTLPKSGTYLIQEFLKQLGSHSTGWHIEYERYLDTRSFDEKVNREHPSTTAKDRLYLESFRAIPCGWHAFGHLSPLNVPDVILKRGFTILCAHRDLKEILVSQFIDFRYRRADVGFVSQSFEPDLHKAFKRYLEIQGPILRVMAIDFIIYRDIWASNLYCSAFKSSPPLFFRFHDFLSPDVGPLLAVQIARKFGHEIDKDKVMQAWQFSLDADNKTKAIDDSLEIDRSSLWTDSALHAYRKLGFEELERNFV